MPECFGGAKCAGGGEFLRFRPTRKFNNRRRAT